MPVGNPLKLNYLVKSNKNMGVLTRLWPIILGNVWDEQPSGVNANFTNGVLKVA